MRLNLLTALALPVGLLLSVVPMMAHHSFAAEYDINKPITLTGTVTKMEWKNPHIYFYLDVKDDSGKVVNWGIQGGSASQLYRYGYTKDTLQIGNQITVNGFLARDGSNLANMVIVTRDGKKVLGRIESPEELK